MGFKPKKEEDDDEEEAAAIWIYINLWRIGIKSCEKGYEQNKREDKREREGLS